jgi:hypothetical protein
MLAAGILDEGAPHGFCGGSKKVAQAAEVKVNQG